MNALSLRHCGIFENRSQLSRGFRFQMACEDYFHLGDRQVYPILEANNRQITVDIDRRMQTSSGFMTALKILSFVTVILPLIIGLYVLAKRATCQVQDINTLIKNTPVEFQTYNRDLAENPQDADCIINGLHLGNGYGFLDCTGLGGIDILDELGRPVGERSTNNPLGFQHMVTMCPLTDLGNRADALHGAAVTQGEPLIGQHFTATGVNWFYAGRAISDISSGNMGTPEESIESRRAKWAVFIHDTTFPNNRLSLFEPYGREKDDYYANIQAKENTVNPTEANAVEMWFEPAFAVLDRAVFHGERALVHCSEGKSRSATLIIAYLVKRFQVTTEEAIRFVRSKRPLIKPGFEPELKEYELHLTGWRFRSLSLDD